jgi:hypothetical protein
MSNLKSKRNEELAVRNHNRSLFTKAMRQWKNNYYTQGAKENQARVFSNIQEAIQIEANEKLKKVEYLE